MKKKVVQIGGNLRINGISSFIMTLYRNLHNNFQFIFINTAEGKDHYRKEIEELGGKVYDVIVRGRGVFRALRQARQIRKIIRAEKPIAVHSHYYSNNGLYLKQAFREGVPVRISHCHQSNPGGLTLGKKIAKYFSAKMVKKYATNAIACSENARKFLYGNGGEVYFNAVDYDRFCPPKEDVYAKYKFDKEKRYCLFVGRFSEQKNTDFLLSLCKSMKEITSLHFLLVGHGAKEEEIRQFIAKNGLKNVTILSPDSNVVELMSVASAFLLPSLYEGLPITLIEAQAVGVPCIVSDVVTEEVQLGLVEYLPLKRELWVEAIRKYVKTTPHFSPKRSGLFDDKYQAALFDGIYSCIGSDEWIQRGKEYSIGSKRFPRSKEMSFASFKRAHLLGNARGTFYYALAFFEGNGAEKDKEKAAELVAPIVQKVERKANETVAEYVVILADMYSFGLGKKQSFETAFSLYLKAAELGNLEAMCDLGYMYLVGQGVGIDRQKSAYWFKKSADLGYVHSMRDIGQNYLHGEGVVQSGEDAVCYFTLASENNYAHGTMDLAYCYLNGIGVQKDLQKVKELFLLAIRQDAERTMRDLISLQVDIKTLLSGGDIRFSKTDTIDKIDEQNSYHGCVCISGAIKTVDPACFYDADVNKIFVEKENSRYSALAGVLFDKEKKTLVRFPPKSPETRYTVPDGVTVIGKHAFQNARNLTEIILPETVTVIQDSAFDDCKRLETIRIPDSVTSVGAWAFHGCDKIRHIALSKNVEHIGTYAFGSCELLESIGVDEDNTVYCSYNGDLYTKDMRVLLQYSIGKKNDTFLLPTQTERIAFRAVSDAYFLKSADLQNVKTIEDKAFYYATSLACVKVLPTVEFGKDIFSHTCVKLQKEVSK